jgi:hypothetical protein
MPGEEGLRIAIDEINAFLMRNNMLIYLVVFDAESTELGRNLDTDLEAYIDRKYVEKKLEEEYDCAMPTVAMRRAEPTKCHPNFGWHFWGIFTIFIVLYSQMLTFLPPTECPKTLIFRLSSHFYHQENICFRVDFPLLLPTSKTE